jgi:hypothetical protein
VVKLTSKSIVGYTVSAHVNIEARPSAGLFDLRVPQGEYTVDIIPSDSNPVSPRSIDIVVTGAALDMGKVELTDMVSVVTQAIDPAGNPVPNTIIICYETGFSHRQWYESTDSGGSAVLTLPQTPLICELIPPLNSGNLARTHVDILAPTDAARLEIGEGHRLNGDVSFPVLDPESDSYGAQALPTALLEFQNDQGRVLASTSSEDDGAYEVVIAASPSTESQ